MNIPSYFQKFAQAAQKALGDLKQQFLSIRTNRINTAILDRVRVSSYGSELPVNQVATVGVADARTLEIRPWDPQLVAEIDKAIRKADIGVTPSVDGSLLRLIFPSLTEDRRKEYSRIAKKYAEDMRVRIRNERRVAQDAEIAKPLKDKKITMDDKVRRQQELDGLTVKFTAEVDSLVASKEKEIFEI